MSFFFLLALAACAQPGPGAELVGDAGSGQDGFSILRVSEGNGCYSLQIDYPQLDNSEIDRQIRSWVNDKYYSTTREFNALCANVRPRQPFKLWVEYELHRTPRTVSLAFKSLIYAGGDQYHDRVDTLNYLWKNGEDLDYKDIFASPDGFNVVLSAQVRSSLGPALGDIWRENPEFATALEPGRLSFSRFAITEKGIRLYFPTRKVAPFYAGPQQCDVSLGSLSKLSPSTDIWE